MLILDWVLSRSLFELTNWSPNDRLPRPGEPSVGMTPRSITGLDNTGCADRLFVGLTVVPRALRLGRFGRACADICISPLT
jgi:hypothetical protein